MERPLFELARDRLFGRRQTLIVYPTQMRVEDLIPHESCLHVSPVPLRPNDKRMINNLELTVCKTPSEFPIAEIRIRETNHIQNGLRSLSIDDVRLESGVILIGENIAILLRGVSKGGRRELVIARPEDVDVHSKQHRRNRKPEKLAA